MADAIEEPGFRILEKDGTFDYYIPKAELFLDQLVCRCLMA